MYLLKNIIWFALGGMLLIVLACNEPDKVRSTVTTDNEPSSLTSPVSDSSLYTAISDDTLLEIPVVPIKRPEGIYRFIVSEGDRPTIEHTVQFTGSSFKLEERYLKARDSIVVTEGNWSPSNGYIWIYHDQLVAGRYLWKGNRLEYYDPADKSSYPMDKLASAAEVPALRKKSGLYFYGLGNEPFWNVELDEADSLTLRFADQQPPVKFRLKESWQSTDTTFYLAANDTLSLKLTMLPYFCSDGMSDFTYSFKIKVDFRSNTYHGCAIVYKNR